MDRLQTPPKRTTRVRKTSSVNKPFWAQKATREARNAIDSFENVIRGKTRQQIAGASVAIALTLIIFLYSLYIGNYLIALIVIAVWVATWKRHMHPSNGRLRAPVKWRTVYNSTVFCSMDWRFLNRQNLQMDRNDDVSKKVKETFWYRRLNRRAILKAASSCTNMPATLNSGGTLQYSYGILIVYFFSIRL